MHGPMIQTACFITRFEPQLPQPLAQALANITAVYEKHAAGEARLLQNLVDSQVMLFANSSITDPICLAHGFHRSSCTATHVKGFVKLYRQRTMANNVLGMAQTSLRMQP